MQTKECSVCGLTKPLNQYRKYTGRAKYGTRPLCKKCQRKYEMGWRDKKKDYLASARKKRKKKNQQYAMEYRVKSAAKYLVGECRRRCQKNGIPFDLDKHMEEIQNRIDYGVCELTGIPFNKEPKPKRRYNSPSLDRIIPERGYLYKNIRIVLVATNLMIGNWGLETTLKIAKALVKKNGG